MGIKLCKKKDKIKLSIFDDLSDIRILRHSIGIWLEDMDISSFKILSIKLCLIELTYNAILHSYQKKPDIKKVANINIQKINNYIEIIVNDYGKTEWYKNYVIPDKNDKKRMISSPHGRGLLIIKSLADELKITNALNKGTEVFVKIRL